MNISKNKLLHIIFIFITLASLTIVISCSSEEEIVVPKEENEQTVIMFFPWSSNLLPYFQQNIKDFSKSIEERGSQNARVMVCLATTPNTADLMELKYDNGSCIVENIRTYDNQRFTSQEVCIRHEINRLLFEYFGGSYKVQTNPDGKPTILFTFPSGRN